MESFTLTYWQRRHLERSLRSTPDAHVYRRTLAILEVAQGESVSSVARRLRVNPRTVYYWIESYAANPAPNSLRDHDRSGRPCLVTEKDRGLLRELLVCCPKSWATSPPSGRCPYSGSTWPNALASLSRMTPSGEKYAGWATPGSDPATPWILIPSGGGKKRRILRQIRHLPSRSVILAEDETDLLLFPPLRACWSLRGKPKEVLLCGRNARRVVFGAMNLRSGRRLFLAREHQRAGDFQAFLRLVHSSYRGWQVAMLLDEDPAHTAGGSVRLAEDLGVELLWLPKRCPKLNPIDTLWGQGKDVVSADKQYATIDEQVDRLIGYLQSLSPWQALHTAGVYSKDCWLRAVL